MSLRILTVCTGNICRSPMAEVLLQHHLDQHGIDAVVRSAGTLHARSYRAADDDAIAVMAERGLDLSGHRPRPVDRELVEADGADLVLAMTREHLRHVALLARGTFARTFTAKELARRLPSAKVDDRETTGVASDPARLAALLTAAGAGRSPAQLMGDHDADDVADPYGRSIAVFRRSADEIDALMQTIARAIAGR